MNTNNNARVMHYAHVIYRNYAGSLNWSTSLTEAWRVDYICRLLSAGLVEFSYFKANTDLRTARGTKNPDLIPVENPPKGIVARELALGLREPNYQTISYYDIDKKDWRAFSVDSLVDITRFWSLKPQAVDE